MTREINPSVSLTNRSSKLKLADKFPDIRAINLWALRDIDLAPLLNPTLDTMFWGATRHVSESESDTDPFFISYVLKSHHANAWFHE